MKKRFFVTGTDTNAGKTFVTTGLLGAAKRADIRAFGLKPVSAGAEWVSGVLRHGDGLLIQQASSVNLPYEQVNPVVFEPRVSPHIAAQKENKLVTAARIEGYIKGALLTPHDFCLVEGAGGWRVPINDRELLSDVARLLSFPVILVVNMKLGCLNHAILTAEAIVKDGLEIAGWVANTGPDTMPNYEENIESLVAMLPAPLIGILPWSENEKETENQFDKLFLAL